jgi:hypothetical protein
MSFKFFFKKININLFLLGVVFYIFSFYLFLLLLIGGLDFFSNFELIVIKLGYLFLVSLLFFTLLYNIILFFLANKRLGSVLGRRYFRLFLTFLKEYSPFLILFLNIILVSLALVLGISVTFLRIALLLPLIILAYVLYLRNSSVVGFLN